MSLLIPRRRWPSAPVGGQLALNKSHPDHAGVVFAWHGCSQSGLLDMTGRFRLTTESATKLGASRAGMTGALNDANSSGLRCVIPDAYIGFFTGPLTIFWRGTILGSGSGYAFLGGITYGNGGTSPNSVLGLQVNGSNATELFTVGQTAGYSSYTVFNPLSTARHGIPCTIAVTNVGAATNPQTGVLFDDGTYSESIASFGGAPGRTVTTDNQIVVTGGPGSDPARNTNAITESLVILNRSPYTGPAGSDKILPNMMRDYASFFTTVGASRAINVVFAGAAPQPEIAVTGNSNNIADGDITPSVTDNTDFGTTTQSSPTARSYSIANSGSASLVISSVALSGTGAAQFTITTDPTGTITAGGSATLSVQATAATVGTHTATVTINSNDADEAAFNFDIQVIVNAGAGAARYNFRSMDAAGMQDLGGMTTR